MEYIFTIVVKTDANVTKDEVKDFISFECGASCQISNDNPFIDEDNEAEITRIDLY